MILADVDVEEAKKRIVDCDGFVRQAIKKNASK
jgi:N-acetylmuramic acid 6-phosphate (MurNAc-6-P) etherase